MVWVLNLTVALTSLTSKTERPRTAWPRDPFVPSAPHDKVAWPCLPFYQEAQAQFPLVTKEWLSAGCKDAKLMKHAELSHFQDWVYAPLLGRADLTCLWKQGHHSSRDKVREVFCGQGSLSQCRLRSTVTFMHPLLAGNPGFYKKLNWASHGKQAS